MVGRAERFAGLRFLFAEAEAPCLAGRITGNRLWIGASSSYVIRRGLVRSSKRGLTNWKYFPYLWRYGEVKRYLGPGRPRPGIPSRYIPAAGAGRDRRVARWAHWGKARAAFGDPVFPLEPAEAG